MQSRIREGGAEILPCADDFPRPDNTVLCLPFQAGDEQFVYSANTPTIEKLLREANLGTMRPVLKGQLRYRDEQSIVWLGPILFFSAAALAENPNLMSIALGVISNYLTDFFRGTSTPNPEVKLDVIQEITPKKKFRHAVYSGPVAGLSSLPEVLRTTFKEFESQEKENG